MHGLFGDARSTWTNANGAYWPGLLTADGTFDDSDIYVHSFPSPKFRSTYDVDELAGRLRIDLTDSSVLRDHKEIVFICHSMGGIVVRAFLLKARIVPQKIPLLFFISTPTNGADVARVAAALSRNPQPNYLLPGDTEIYLRKIQSDWLDTSLDAAINYPTQIASYCAYEKRSIVGAKVVSQSSASALCNRPLIAIDEDHVGIVKPKDHHADIYRAFRDAYSQTFDVAPDTEICPPLHVDFIRGTINGLSPTATQDEVLAAIPCDGTDRRDRIEYRRSGIAFHQKPPLIDAWNPYLKQSPTLIGQSSDTIRRLLKRRPTFTDARSGDLARRHWRHCCGPKAEHLARELYAMPYGCLEITLVNDSAFSIRMNTLKCNLQYMGIDAMLPLPPE